MRCVKCSIMKFHHRFFKKHAQKNAFGRKPEAFFVRTAIFFVTKREF